MSDTSNHDLDAIKEEMNKGLTNRYPYSGHTEVVACVFFWENADKAGYREEAERIRTLFTEKFGYSTQLHAIPNRNSHFFVDRVVTELLERYDSESTLLIIFYGGHGDADSGRDEGGELRERRSVWAA